MDQFYLLFGAILMMGSFILLFLHMILLILQQRHGNTEEVLQSVTSSNK